MNMLPHLNLQIETRIGAQMRRTLIPHLKSLWKTSKIKIEMKIEMEKYIFLSVAADCNAEMQIEMRDGGLLNTSQLRNPFHGFCGAFRDGRGTVLGRELPQLSDCPPHDDETEFSLVATE